MYLQRYDSYGTKLSSQDSHLEGPDYSDFQDKKPRQHSKQRVPLYSYTNPLPHGNSSMDFYEHSTREAYVYNSNKNLRIGSIHGVEGMKSDSVSNHSDHHEGNFSKNLTDSLLHGYDDVNLKNLQRSECIKSKPSKAISKACASMDAEDRGLSTRMVKFN